MKKLFIFLTFLISASAYAGDFTVSVPSAKSGMFTNAQVLNGFGCSGGNVSPEIIWQNPPEGTKSFALTIYDPDAPTGSGWWHWVITDIPADVRRIESGSVPKGAVESATDFGKPGYGGPCPPEGTNHRYIVTVTALKTGKLGISPFAGGAMAGFMINMNAIAKASAIIRYGR
ncbi:YbhB/YbcL family Raf kinase inhibitor-like protein [Seleniivibrio woodruffii]|uniref:YbhB/YbcL family Raf kinase inhibitor-like protein n=1 Tax=Seleniivibrio woodruffii TaxID=1078050 RepID=UPI002409FBBE|nr:YbhB/YbcL family Raf kinase inhibitor-like protein [Seleniivibrio woodruffii]